MTKVYELASGHKVKQGEVTPDDERSDLLDVLTEGEACSINVLVAQTHLDETEVRRLLSEMMREGIVVKRDESGITLDRI